MRLKTTWSGERAPDLDDFRTAVKDCHLVLILDELERGIDIISDATKRSQNIAFLQMLSEEAGCEGSHLTLFAAVYDGNKEPGSTLKRTQRIELHFRKPQDRASIVRHRLYKNADSYDKEAARALIQSYINTWRRFGMEVPDGYVGRMEESFPFLPDLIELVFERITESGGFQGTRSALGLLGAMLDATPEGSFSTVWKTNSPRFELDAMRHGDDTARDQITLIWLQEVFRENHQTVIYRDLEEAKVMLQGFSRHGQRYVLAPRRLSQAERFALYQGLELRNQVLLLEPRDPRVDHLTSPDLLALAKRLKAARLLASSSTNAERRTKFEQIERAQVQQIQRTLKSAGLLYIRIERWGDQASQAQFEEEGLGQASSKEEVLNYLRSQVFPPSLIEEHLRRNLPSFFNQRVEQIERAYRNTLGYPVPLTVTVVTEILRSLAADRNPVLGFQHPRGNFCGERVSLTDSELNQAVLSPPWQAPSERSGPPALPGAAMPASAGVETAQSATTEVGAGEQSRSTPASTVEERSTPSCRSLGELRQQTAARLTDMNDPVIRTVRFTIFADHRGQDLSGLPAAYRGALSGPGDVSVQLDIVVPGPMTKAVLEQHCEKLPNLNSASCTARFSVEISRVSSSN